MFPLNLSENIRKSKVFLCFQRISKEKILKKQVNELFVYCQLKINGLKAFLFSCDDKVYCKVRKIFGYRMQKTLSLIKQEKLTLYDTGMIEASFPPTCFKVVRLHKFKSPSLSHEQFEHFAPLPRTLWPVFSSSLRICCYFFRLKVLEIS